MVLYHMSTRILIAVSPNDGLPIYRQIVEQVKGAVAAGLLAPGDRLPSHRDLSGELVVAPLTVKKAYDTLESEGVVRTERGRGTFVARRSAETAGEALRALAIRARGLARQARVMGLGVEEVIEVVRRAFREAQGGDS